MNEALRAIFQFNKESYTPDFLEVEKQISSRIQNSLANIYLNDGNEVDLVKNTIQAMNEASSRRFKLESLFIHGNKSQIQFEYYGKTAKKEMGDLIFVSTLTYKSKPYFQKMTIVQAKKDTAKRLSSWGIDPEQLFFLTYWPPFQGVRGIFPKGETTVPDHSGCLGSYALYREPGDFVFMAAKRLGKSLSHKKRVSMEEIQNISNVHYIHEPGGFQTNLFPFGIHHSKDLYYLLEDFYHLYGDYAISPFFSGNKSGLNVMQNESLCLNVFDTISQLARLNIGELVFCDDRDVKTNEFAYRLLNTVIQYISQTDEGHSMDLVSFNRDGPTLEEFDLRDTRIAIIHTISEAGPAG